MVNTGKQSHGRYGGRLRLPVNWSFAIILAAYRERES